MDSLIHKQELFDHGGIVFAIWHEEWETSHAEDITERVKFIFDEASARNEFRQRKLKLGANPEVIRELLALFRLSLPPSQWSNLPEENDEPIRGEEYFHPVKSLRRKSAIHEFLSAELLETGGAATVDFLWAHMT